MKKRIFSIIICLAMLLSAVPLSVSAGLTAPSSQINVGGTLCGQSSVGSGKGWEWDGSSYTLTLDNYNGGAICSNFYPFRDITIILKGKNKITVNDICDGGIYANNSSISLYGESDATLEITAPNANYGIYASKNISIYMPGGLIINSVNDSAIYSVGDISGGGDISVTCGGNSLISGKKNSIYLPKTTSTKGIILTNNGNLTVEGTISTVTSSNTSVTVDSKGNTSITSSDEYSIVANKILLKGSGTLTVSNSVKDDSHYSLFFSTGGLAVDRSGKTVIDGAIDGYNCPVTFSGTQELTVNGKINARNGNVTFAGSVGNIIVNSTGYCIVSDTLKLTGSNPKITLQTSSWNAHLISGSEDLGEYKVTDGSLSENYAVLSSPQPITVNADSKLGTAKADVRKAYAGDTVTLSANPNPGYFFSGWWSDDVIVVNNQFIMPDYPVTVEALFEQGAMLTSVSLSVKEQYMINNAILKPTYITASGTTASVTDVEWYLDESPVTVAGVGKLSALVTVTAQGGYRFEKNATATVSGKTVSAVSVSADSKTAKFYIDAAYITCPHTGDTSSWKQNDEQHWKVCTVCSSTYGKENHTYGAGVSSAGGTTYTCTKCSYKKFVSNGKTLIRWDYLTVDELIAGNKLTAPKPKSSGKFTVSSYQWYRDSVATGNKRSVGSSVESGTYYYLVTTLKPSSGYYFDDTSRVRTEAFSENSTDCKLNGDGTLTCTTNFSSAPLTDVHFTLPTITAGMTFGQVKDGVSYSVNGVENAPLYLEDLAIYTVENGESELIVSYIGVAGEWAGDYSEFDSMVIQPAKEYIVVFMLAIWTGEQCPQSHLTYTAGNSVKVEYHADYSNVTPAVSAEYHTEGNLISQITVNGIDAPTPGNTPDNTVTVPYGCGYKVTGGKWSASSFTCDTEYTITLTVKANNNNFSASPFASVDGYSATAKKNTDGTVTVTYTFPKTEHSWGAFTVVKPTCTEAGRTESTCKNCGKTQTVSTASPLGHSYAGDTCVRCGHKKSDVLIGDINFDGKVNTVDLSLMKQFVLDVSTPTSDEFEAADINGDGKINPVDSNLLKQLILGEN